MKPAENVKTLGQFPVGCRLLVRSKKDWRFAVVVRKTEEFISISVASPTGYNYRLRRPIDLEVLGDGPIPWLVSKENDIWQENFSNYDLRW